MKRTAVFTIIAFTFLSFSGFSQESWKAPESSKSTKNPVSEKKVKASAKKGAITFNKFCIVCHGAAGLGDGPGGKALTPKPANLTSLKVQDQKDGEIFWKISNGRGPMIKWGPIINESDRWDLVNYIRTLKN
ncbi:MAG: cytochrome c [Flavobacteriales bacterium]|jgi:mono/diheme cytochrome c family protein|nr:cytochrome c [Flavobacteriales bacterium]